ncbi:hypothetical protein FPV67DRAFT_809958 [Lyophyllum atratum]|nr:hypothetical protein FPV67DRAFT_809958 [Lyophyllum atratum]
MQTCSAHVNPELIRTIRCNRAACYNELERYQQAAEDCALVLADRCSPLSRPITLKAHLRLARSLHGLGDLERATMELDKFRALNGKSQASELSLRVRILQDQVAQDSVAEDQCGLATRLLHYVVRTSRPAPIVIDDQVPTVLCSTNPPRIPTNAFLTHLVQKYDQRIMHSHEWTCWKCPAKAESMVHTPCAYFHLEEPVVVDLAQPICIHGGECEQQARALMAGQMAKLSARSASKMA